MTKQRGELVEWELEPLVMATVHPSSILRARDPDAREAEFAGFVADLTVAADVLRSAAR